MSEQEEWSAAQRRYYDERDHSYLEPSRGGRYAENIVDKLWAILGVAEDTHGLEIGCGAGRFTLPLLSRCRSLEVTDLSRRQLDLLGEQLQRHGVEGSRCQLHEADVERLDELLPENRFDFVTGVFILHHLHDARDTIRRIHGLLKPGGRAVFLEPNRWNPLYLLQILLMKDFSFREERKLYELGSHRLRRFVREAGFQSPEIHRGGFFPPQVVNRFDWSIGLEKRLEGLGMLQPVLPFVMISGTRASR